LALAEVNGVGTLGLFLGLLERCKWNQPWMKALGNLQPMARSVLDAGIVQSFS
jgi:hypothetical protein